MLKESNTFQVPVLTWFQDTTSFVQLHSFWDKGRITNLSSWQCSSRRIDASELSTHINSRGWSVPSFYPSFTVSDYWPIDAHCPADFESSVLRAVLDERVCSTPSMTTASLRVLEDYYIWFPTQLLDMKKIRRSYEAEAMIWFHGLHLMICK